MKDLSVEELNKRADFLSNQVNYNGWGRLHRDKIYNELGSGNEKFFIAVPDKIREVPVVGVLNFEQSNVKENAYMQYKGFDLTAPGPDKELFNQSFKYSPYQTFTKENGDKIKVNSPLSKTEAFNVMGGGAVLGTFTKKDPINGNISVYKAYSTLNFKFEDHAGNIYTLKELSARHNEDTPLKLIKDDNVNMIKLPDFGIEYKISQLQIVDLDKDTNKQDYIDRMNRGFTVEVGINVGGQVVQRNLKADPFNGTIAQYNEKMERIDLVKGMTREQSIGHEIPGSKPGDHKIKGDHLDSEKEKTGLSRKKKDEKINSPSQKNGIKKTRRQRI